MGLSRTTMPPKIQLLAVLTFGVAMILIENQIQRLDESRVKLERTIARHEMAEAELRHSYDDGKREVPLSSEEDAVIIYNRVPKTASTSFTNIAYDLCGKNRFHVLHINTTKNNPVMSLQDQVRFIQNVSAWREMKPAFYHGHVAYLDFSSILVFDSVEVQKEDKDMEGVSDSPGRTQEPYQNHTSSPKNNAAGLSSDEHGNPLNGTQLNPFVYSSVPAVPHAGNSLPSGALVNGPASHSTSDIHCVLNKGNVLSYSVLNATWQVKKDTSPEVLPPPSELQSDAWKNTAGPIVKTPAAQPGVNASLSHSRRSSLNWSSPDIVELTHINQPLVNRRQKNKNCCSRKTCQMFMKILK